MKRRLNPEEIERIVCGYVLPVLAILYVLAMAIMFR